VLKHVRAGRLRPVVDTVLPLAEARRAHERIEARQMFGKVVLVP
jgi:NADPH:quinone reductase-like Zn-dependent oxidoreductase